MPSLVALATLPDADLIINGLVGAVGFIPLSAAIKAGKTIALANKEPIVMAGRALMDECRRWNATIIPVDSNLPQYSSLWKMWTKNLIIKPSRR